MLVEYIDFPEDPTDDEYRYGTDFSLMRMGALSQGDFQTSWPKAPERMRRRNTHCSNCGDTRGGPVGHEIGECTWRSSAQQH